MSKIPYSIVIGDNERDNDVVTYRKYGEKEQTTVSTSEYIAMLHEIINSKKL